MSLEENIQEKIKKFNDYSSYSKSQLQLKTASAIIQFLIDSHFSFNECLDILKMSKEIIEKYRD